jgi:hypothetical protein
MIVITTKAERAGEKPKVIVTLSAGELDVLLVGGTQRFEVVLDEGTKDVEILATSTKPTTPKPHVRLRVADDALRAARVGTVTPLFAAPIPFQLVLMCSDAPPDGPVRISPGLTYERVNLGAPTTSSAPRATSPLVERAMIGAGVVGFFAFLGWVRGESILLYVVCGLVGAIWYAVDGDRLTRGRR